MLYYLFWGVSAAMIQIWVNPSSGIPMLGASGAIAGVMGAYLLLYPASRIRVVIMPIFLIVEFRAWFLLSFWFLMQIFLVQPGVANWAHAGGFLMGMLIVLLVRKKPEKLNKNVRADYL
jgi:membrane associated rhomboid family serine protease